MVQYRDYSNHSSVDFRFSIIINVIPNSSVSRDFDGLDSAIKSTLNNYVPIKKNYVHANKGPFVTQKLRKAIVNNKSNENWAAYKC